MGNEYAQLSDPNERKGSSEEKIDYTPKEHKLRDQIIFGIKLIAIGAGICLLLWLIEQISF